MRIPVLLATVLVTATSLTGSVEAQTYRDDPRDRNLRRDEPYEQPRGGDQGAFTTRLRTYRFADVLRPTPLPRSRGAAMCSLTTVDDDTHNGWCKVFFDEQVGEWMSQTGGGADENNCEATCMWIGPRADEEEVQERPRFRRFE